MGIKKIFSKGFAEFKRRTMMLRERRKLQKLQDGQSREWMALGKKAWESRIDLSAYGNLKKLISDSREIAGQLSDQLDQLRKAEEKTEGEIQKEKGQYRSEKAEAETEKREKDFQVSRYEKEVEKTESGLEDINRRISDLNRQRDQYSSRLQEDQKSDLEKKEIRQKIDAVGMEKEELQKELEDQKEALKKTRERLAPEKEAAAKLQQKIDAVVKKEKKTLDKLEKELKNTREEIRRATGKQEAMNREIEGYYEKLGKKLARDTPPDPAVGKEMARVKNSEKKITQIGEKLDKLESEASAETRSAFWQMIAIAAGGIVLAVIIVLILISLLGGKSDPAGDPIPPPTVTRGGSSF